MRSALQEFLDEAWISRIPAGLDGAFQAFGRLDQILGQIGGDQIVIDATQLASQMLSDRIAENTGVGWRNVAASHDEEMETDLLGINAKVCGKLTQFFDNYPSFATIWGESQIK